MSATPGRVPNPTVVFSGYTVLCSDADGSIAGPRHGLFHEDTRVLSHYQLLLGGQRPELLSAAQPESDQWAGVLRQSRPGGAAPGPQLPQDTIEIRVQRRVGPGMREDVTIRNHSAIACDTDVRLDIEADFADVAEVVATRHQRGQVRRSRLPDGVRFDYVVERDDRRDVRGMSVRVVDHGQMPVADREGLRFRVHLDPRGEWRTSIQFAVLDDGEWRAPDGAERDRRADQRRAWRARRPGLAAPAPLQSSFERAADDLFDLRNWELERRFLGRTNGRAWIVNAGVPIFTGLFGRDSITAGWQSSLLGPRALLGALDAVAATQATTDDPWRDAEPGKLIHELRAGPLARLGMSPRDAYYGTQTTAAMFVLALSELWHWTGDETVLRRHRDVALRALAWAERYGDADRDGFLEYEKRSPEGLVNQAWKDSDEAIRHPDGQMADGPIATVEEQAFHCIALERMAEILVALGDDAAAEPFLEQAAVLRRRWHDAYWMADEGFYALALDGSKRQVRSITSNPGHALGTGVVPRDHARIVADRLMAPDLFSGWGVRTLSARHPSYNPLAYHLGAVWPVEQATFALGFKRYGLDDHLDRLVDGVLAAAAASDNDRLPEALSGHERGTVFGACQYPESNSPQAWSASALVQIVQIMLGLYPFAPLHVLAVVRPRLPEWVPSLTLRRLRVGDATVDLRFDRRDDGSAAWHVEGLRGRLIVVPAEAPDAVDDGWLAGLRRRVVSKVPGRQARAARIALGGTAFEGE